ncbi:MAG: pyridoxamine 5'-phosphate oxidase family protein [Desulfobacterales bacterium]|nr:pyridoxamine 5'-phosphate oxidase family protein [Desulfobacterales bacterium]
MIEMRKKEREINDKEEIETILKKATVMRIALVNGDMPYIVPVAFGYKDDVIYFHSSRKGMKMDIIRKNNNICFEVETDVALVEGQKPCDFNFEYRSVIGFGTAHILESDEEKRKGFDVLMTHYADPPFEYKPQGLKAAFVVKIGIDGMKGKKPDSTSFA